MSERQQKIPSDEKNEDFSRLLIDAHQKVEEPPCQSKEQVTQNFVQEAFVNVRSIINIKNDENFIQNQIPQTLNQNLEEQHFDHENLEQRPKEDESDPSHNNEIPKSQQETYASEGQGFLTQSKEEETPESQICELDQVNRGTIEQGEVVQENNSLQIHFQIQVSPIRTLILPPIRYLNINRNNIYGIPQNYNALVQERTFLLIPKQNVFDPLNCLKFIQKIQGYQQNILKKGIPLQINISKQLTNNFEIKLVFESLYLSEKGFRLYNIAKKARKNRDYNQQNENIYENLQFIQKEKIIEAIEVQNSEDAQYQDQLLLINEENEVENEEDLQNMEAYRCGSIKVIEGSN